MDMSMGLSLEVARAHTNMGDLQAETGCSGASCDDILMEYTEHPLWYCSGETAVGEGGNFKGHVFPGCMFLIWATHWMVGAMIRYFRYKASSRPWEAKSSEQVLWFQGKPIESIIKVTLPPLAMLLELWLAHPGGYRLLVCGKGEVRAGHFVGNHLNNWAHAAMYIGFIFSGIVELIGTKVALPKGTNHVFLGVGFMAESVLMGLHKKHSPLDIIVHFLLFLSMALSGIACFLEVLFPNNFLVSASRIASVYLQGFWFIGTAHIMYKGLMIWRPDGGDLSPTMYAPIVFCTHVLSIFLIFLCAYIVSYIYFVGVKGKSSTRKETVNGPSSLDRLPSAPDTDGSSRYRSMPAEGLPVSTHSQH